MGKMGMARSALAATLPHQDLLLAHGTVIEAAEELRCFAGKLSDHSSAISLLHKIHSPMSKVDHALIPEEPIVG
jgi:hypothetical protein